MEYLLSNDNDNNDDDGDDGQDGDDDDGHNNPYHWLTTCYGLQIMLSFYNMVTFNPTFQWRNGILTRLKHLPNGARGVGRKLNVRSLILEYLL